MRLEEAKQILNNNGYELLDEGKLGRVLGIGALALGSFVGNANAINQDDIDRFEKQVELSQSTSDVRRIGGQTLKSYIKNGDYYIDVKFGKDIKRYIFKENGEFISKIKDTHYNKSTNKNDVWIEHSFGIWHFEYKTDVTLEEFVGNLDVIEKFPQFNDPSCNIEFKKGGIYTSITKMINYHNNKKIHEWSENKSISYDENGEISRVTISKKGRDNTYITKSLNADGSITDEQF